MVQAHLSLLSVFKSTLREGKGQQEEPLNSTNQSLVEQEMVHIRGGTDRAAAVILAVLLVAIETRPIMHMA